MALPSFLLLKLLPTLRGVTSDVLLLRLYFHHYALLNLAFCSCSVSLHNCVPNWRLILGWVFWSDHLARSHRLIRPNWTPVHPIRSQIHQWLQRLRSCGQIRSHRVSRADAFTAHRISETAAAAAEDLLWPDDDELNEMMEDSFHV